MEEGMRHDVTEQERTNPGMDAPHTDRQGDPEQAKAGLDTSGISQSQEVLKKLDAYIRSGRRVPMTKMSMLEEGTLLDLLGQMRIAMPKAIVQAQNVLAQSEEIARAARQEAEKLKKNAQMDAQEIRDKANEYDRATRAKAQGDAGAIIEDANTRANAILLNAQQTSQAMIDDSEITRRANAFAMETRDRAMKDADSIINQALTQADKILSGAAAVLTRNGSEMAAFRDELLRPYTNPSRNG